MFYGRSPAVLGPALRGQLRQRLKSKESFQNSLRFMLVIARSEAVGVRPEDKPAASKNLIPCFASEQACATSSRPLFYWNKPKTTGRNSLQLGDEIIALTDKRTDEGSDELIPRTA